MRGYDGFFMVIIIQFLAIFMVAIVLLAIVADAIAEAEANPVAGSSSGQ
jgi:hypothetical protein